MAEPTQSAKQKKALAKLIDQYYADLADFAQRGILSEGGTRFAFHHLMASCVDAAVALLQSLSSGDYFRRRAFCEA